MRATLRELENDPRVWKIEKWDLDYYRYKAILEEGYLFKDELKERVKFYNTLDDVRMDLERNVVKVG